MTTLNVASILNAVFDGVNGLRLSGSVTAVPASNTPGIDSSHAAYIQERPALYLAVTIGNGTSLSAAVALGNYLLAGISIPASGSWTAANLTFQASVDGGVTYFDLWKDGSEYVVTVTPVTNGSFLILSPADFAAFTHIKVRSGTAASCRVSV